jgi:hypothetical protein
MDSVSFAKRLGVHDLLGGAFATDHAVQRINPGGMAINHGEVVGDEDHGKVMLLVDLAD